MICAAGRCADLDQQVVRAAVLALHRRRAEEHADAAELHVGLAELWLEPGRHVVGPEAGREGRDRRAERRGQDLVAGAGRAGRDVVEVVARQGQGRRGAEERPVEERIGRPVGAVIVLLVALVDERVRHLVERRAELVGEDQVLGRRAECAIERRAGMREGVADGDERRPVVDPRR